MREFLSQSGKVDDVAVQHFVEAAIGNYLMRKSTARLHAATAHLPEEDITELVDEALEWARARG